MNNKEVSKFYVKLISLLRIKESVLTFLSGMLLSISINMATNLIEPTGIKSFTLVFAMPIVLIGIASILLMMIAIMIRPVHVEYDRTCSNDDTVVETMKLDAKNAGIPGGDIWAYYMLMIYPQKTKMLIFRLISSFLLIVVAFMIPFMFSVI
ncbi:MAG: hypothetical protein LBU83_07610 [Bacteroidales bacterium]|jgi:hypothetical protein|nr:hypothetical protein [Bacteroidales bacterium]